ncbi:hypothetical protein [Helicobacter sp. MIT 14-3879]|nr:hypothetical protein [Helicobacter sp. MIT 14-3879]
MSKPTDLLSMEIGGLVDNCSCSALRNNVEIFQENGEFLCRDDIKRI